MFDPKILELTGSLSVSLEYDDYPTDDPKDVYAQFLFVPDKNEPEHWHIPLERDKAEQLRNWLNDYLKSH